MGRLSPGKTAAKYLAPNRRGIATIKLQVEENGSVVYADSIEILIYRQFILLKADDFVLNSFGQVPPAWLKFIDFIVSRRIRASLGLIAQSLEKGNFFSLPYLTRLGSSVVFEIWNHGYNHLLDKTSANGHKFDEFRAAPLPFQEEHLRKAQQIVREKLGITMHTFGAPGNKIDDNTKKALNELSEIKVWYFGESDPQKLVLKRLAEIELPTFNPNFEQFVSHYDPAQPYLALQIHPGLWNARQFNEFRQIIDFLISRDVTFINPFEYYTLLKNSK